MANYFMTAHFHRGDPARFEIHDWLGYGLLRIGSIDLYFHDAQRNLLEEALPDIWAARKIHLGEEVDATV